MKAREIKPLFNKLLTDMPGFMGHKSMLLMTPMNGLLKGILFDSSSYDKFTFYPTYFVMPLCIPIESITLLFGRRLRHETLHESWTAKMPNLEADLSKAIHDTAIPFLSRTDTFLDFVDLAASMSMGNPHTPESIAFAFARAGETERAIATIEAYLPALNLSVYWEKTMADQSTLLLDLLRKDPALAQAKLQEWETYTIQKLGLEQFA